MMREDVGRLFLVVEIIFWEPLSVLEAPTRGPSSLSLLPVSHEQVFCAEHISQDQ